MESRTAISPTKKCRRAEDGKEKDTNQTNQRPIKQASPQRSKQPNKHTSRRQHKEHAGCTQDHAAQGVTNRTKQDIGNQEINARNTLATYAKLCMQVVADQAGTSNAILSKGSHRAQQRDSRDQQKPPKPRFEDGALKSNKAPQTPNTNKHKH